MKFAYADMGYSSYAKDFVVGDMFIEDRYPYLFKIVDIEDETLFACKVGRVSGTTGNVKFDINTGPAIRFFGMGNAYGPTLYKITMVKNVPKFKIGDPVWINGRGVAEVRDIDSTGNSPKYILTVYPTKFGNEIKGNWTYIADASELTLRGNDA